MFSLPDMAVILAVVLVIFGPGKLPQIGASLGKGIKDFKKAVKEEEPVPPDVVRHNEVKHLEHNQTAEK